MRLQSVLVRLSSSRKSLARQPGNDGAVQAMADAEQILLELRQHAQALLEVDGNKVHFVTPEQESAWFWVREVARNG